mmetsp:Transcript_64447/g.185224  ORF Transcript_64447/g.185224 Transcript_64447/m.185224 type:complete len:235 (+) Transcript_64447:713-1417(+)
MNGLVAVDGCGVATKDPGSLLVLPLQDPLLVAMGHHQREAVHGPRLARRELWCSLNGLSRRRDARHHALLRHLDTCAALQPALAGATVQLGVLDPRVRLALRNALAHSGAELRVRNVVVVGAPTFEVVVEIDIHCGRLAVEVLALNPCRLILFLTPQDLHAVRGEPPQLLLLAHAVLGSSEACRCHGCGRYRGGGHDGNAAPVARGRPCVIAQGRRVERRVRHALRSRGLHLDA